MRQTTTKSSRGLLLDSGRGIKFSLSEIIPIMFLLTFVITFFCILSGLDAFSFSTTRNCQTTASSRLLKMEYIPNGLTKAQWDAIKKKEAEEMKRKDLAKVGITKFKSRSFEAFQKSGAKNMFPVGPDTPLNERPYMQRPGGSADGEDLKAKGLQGSKQGFFQKKIDVDEKYEKLEAEGKLRSSPFAVPWTAKAAAETFKNQKKIEPEVQKRIDAKKAADAAKKGSAPVDPPAPEKKKGLFGLF